MPASRVVLVCHNQNNGIFKNTLIYCEEAFPNHFIRSIKCSVLLVDTFMRTHTQRDAWVQVKVKGEEWSYDWERRPEDATFWDVGALKLHLGKQDHIRANWGGGSGPLLTTDKLIVPNLHLSAGSVALNSCYPLLHQWNCEGVGIFKQ